MDKNPSNHQPHPNTLAICQILAVGIERRYIKQQEPDNAEREKDNWTNAGTRACMSHKVQRQESHNEE
ncbi:hypothetical protein [Endozoicomonas arenosclerae]|uniref:hypothetical protein n=1 Tax=Endozoicomonas arenosclerae TaxID=1633495 RepID=UPI0007854C77|nr:hypothetical protein [Endozoicomonas arenosclerae]